MDRAREAFSRGQAAFDAGGFEEARAAFEESLAAFPHFRTLFNIGLCAEKLGDVETAIDMYQRYVDWPSEVPNREEVAAKLAALRAALPAEPAPEPDPGPAGPAAAAAPGPDPSPGRSAPPDERETDLRVPGWVAVGAGAAGMIVGGVLLGLANGKKDEMEAVDGEVYDPEKHDAIIEDGRRYEKAGWISGGVGLGVAATGVVLILASRRGGDRRGAPAGAASRLAVLPVATAGAAALDVRWSF